RRSTRRATRCPWQFEFLTPNCLSMSHGRPPAAEPIPISLEPTVGWHCTHLFYRFDRAALVTLSDDQLRRGREEAIATLDPTGPGAPQRLQTRVVSGHKGDFGIMLMDPHPLKMQTVHPRLLSRQ